MIFWLLWGFDALVAAVFVFFFFDGLADGSVSSFNLVLWLGILVGLAAILGGSWLARAKGIAPLAYIILLVLAVPALGFGLLMGFLIISNPRWN